MRLALAVFGLLVGFAWLASAQVPVFPASTNGNNIFYGINVMTNPFNVFTATNSTIKGRLWLGGHLVGYVSPSGAGSFNYPNFDGSVLANASFLGWPFQTATPLADSSGFLYYQNQDILSDAVGNQLARTLTLTNTGSFGTSGFVGIILGPGASIQGDGSGLTNLNASELRSGTVPLAVLPANPTNDLWTAVKANPNGWATNGANVYNTNIINRGVFNAGTDAGVTIDAATREYTLFVTNASYSIAGFSGLITGQQHIFSQTVSNSAASAITITGPPSTFYIGAVSTNSMSLAAGKEAVFSYWIFTDARARTNCMNCQQQ
jgi:hypothetical protein